MRPNLPFVFKQFKVHHDICGMKIGADGVLLGAWTQANSPTNILDVGTGSGLLALMMAQQFPNAEIFALDINPDAILQAKLNFKICPFKNNFQVIQQDFLTFTSAVKFDLIIANLPFLNKSGEISDLNRAQARFAEHLPLEFFLKHASELLDVNGNICMIYPAEHFQEIKTLAKNLNLFCNKLCYIKGNSTSNCKRILFDLSFKEKAFEETTLILEQARNLKTKEYQTLTQNFYLDK